MEDKKSFWQRLWAPTPSKWLLSIPVGGVIALFAGMVFYIGFDVTMHVTNENEFCYGCHIGMDTIVEEYQESIHFKNSAGVKATCSDCHVPKEFIPKMVVKVRATKDIYHKLAGTITLENFEEERIHLAETVYRQMKARDSKECKNCHNPELWDISSQPARARLKHDPNEWQKREETCVDCHSGIAHKRPVIQ